MKIAIFLFYTVATLWAGYMTLHDSGTSQKKESYYNSIRGGSVGYSHSRGGYSYGK